MKRGEADRHSRNLNFNRTEFEPLTLPLTCHVIYIRCSVSLRFSFVDHKMGAIGLTLLEFCEK